MSDGVVLIQSFFDVARCGCDTEGAMVFITELRDGNLLFGCNNCGNLCLVWYEALKNKLLSEGEVL